MSKINVGFIGCGRIADLHFAGYHNNPRARLYAICETDSELLTSRQREWQVEKTYRDYREMLQDRELDAVEILTPHELHEPMVLAALAAGKHVAVQKPMTIDLASADRMLAAAANSPRVYKVTENYVFYPPIVRARQMIEQGEIGEPISVQIKYIGGSTGGWAIPSTAWQWRMKEILAGRGTATFDHGHHLWSTAWFLLGEVERVTAWIDRAEGLLDSPAVMMWKYRNSSRYGSCNMAHANNLHIPSKYYANDEWIEINGTRGIIFIHRCTGNINNGPAMSIFDGHTLRAIDNLDSDWSAGFLGATQNFIDAIDGQAQPLLNGRQAREILKFAIAIQKSSRTHREVYLDELDSSFPALYAWRKRYSLKKSAAKLPAAAASVDKKSFFSFGEDLSKYAPQARSLTEALVKDFDSSKASDWDITIGIHLTADGGVGDERIGLSIKQGRIDLQFGDWPAQPTFTVRMPAGVWAAILLRKKRAEIAFLQGKIKAEGQVEEGLKLRAIFKL